MNPFIKALTVGRIIRRGESRELLHELVKRAYANDVSYILRRDLQIPLKRHPVAKIPISIRPIHHDDVPLLIAERPRRLPVLGADIPTCYLACTANGSICYMQWLIASDQQQSLQPYFKGKLMRYGSDTVLLEFAYTPEKYRGQGIMADAMAQIAEKGFDLGARWAITYVEHDNVASLKGCARAGFRPYMLRFEKWRGLHLSQSFDLLPEGSLYPFEHLDR
ncbi:MAG: GNAT family N-acetyltransferase [Deltaproteobacteria bacterium]|nr:GNAT family N-acetyltransferase [Deltaproteobacteria bacterium]